MKKVLAIIALSLALLVILVGAMVFLRNFNLDHSQRIEESICQGCDIDTTVKNRCYIASYPNVAIEPGESIHVYACWRDGSLTGEYVSEDGETHSFSHWDIYAHETNSKKLIELVKSMNDNTDKLNKEKAVINAVIPGGLLLLIFGALWVGWRRIMRSRVQDSSNTLDDKKGTSGKMNACIVLSLTVLVILFANACNLMINYQIKYSDEMRRNYSRRCDIVTKTSEKCSVHINSSNFIAINPGEAIHIIDCYPNGDLRGAYVTEDSETCYIGYIDVTADKTDSEELQQLVKTMKYNADCIEKKRIAFTGIIIGVHSLLYIGVLFAIWRRFRACHVPK